MAVTESDSLDVLELREYRERKKKEFIASKLKIASKRLDLKMSSKSSQITLLHARVRVLLSRASILASFRLHV